MRIAPLFLLFTIVSSCNDNNNSSSQEDTSKLIGLYKAAPAPKIIYDKLSFGNGYNSVTGKEHFGIMNYVNANQSTEVIGGALGNSGIVTMKIVEDRESLKKVLDINAKVDLDIKLGVFTSDNSAKVNLYKETKFSSFNQNAVLKAQYVNEPLVLLNPSIKEKWISLAKKNPDEFMRTCGDMFVSRIYTGGSMYALYSLHERDDYEEEKNNFFLKSVNKYMGQKLDLEVDVNALTESKSKVTNINTSIITEGGSRTPDSTSLEAFISYANAFKEQVGTDGRAIVLYVELAPYESIAGFPKEVDFNKIRIIQKEFLETCNEYFDLVEQSKSNAQFVLKNPNFFSKTDSLNATIEKLKLSDKTEELRGLIRQCESDFNDCNPIDLKNEFENFTFFNPQMDFPDFESIDVTLPIDSDSDFVEVFPDTGEKGMLFSIQGQLESRLNKNNASGECKDVSLKRDKNRANGRGYGRDKVYSDDFNAKQLEKYVGKKYFKKYLSSLVIDLYEYWERPHYMVRYYDFNTKKFLREFVWDGSELVTEKRVIVKVKLVNPKSKFQLDYRKLSEENGGWANVNADFIKQFKLKPSEKYVSIRACNGELPVATVAVITANKNGEVTTIRTGSENRPKAILTQLEKVSIMQ